MPSREDASTAHTLRQGGFVPADIGWPQKDSWSLLPAMLDSRHVPWACRGPARDARANAIGRVVPFLVARYRLRPVAVGNGPRVLPGFSGERGWVVLAVGHGDPQVAGSQGRARILLAR